MSGTYSISSIYHDVEEEKGENYNCNINNKFGKRFF